MKNVYELKEFTRLFDAQFPSTEEINDLSKRLELLISESNKVLEELNGNLRVVRFLENLDEQRRIHLN
jgi:hypothetical protein